MAESFFAMIRRHPLIQGYWRLNEGAGITPVIDYAARFGLTGVYTSRTPGPSLIQGVDLAAGSSLMAAGNMAVSDVAPLRLIGDMSLGAWIAPYAASQSVLLAGKRVGAVAAPYAIRLNAGALQFALGNGTTEVVLTGPAIPVSIPTLVLAATFRGRMVLYVNGAVVNFGPQGGQAIADGGNSFVAGPFNGLISELALYNGAVSSTTALRQFNVGQQVLPDPAHYSTVDAPAYG